MRRTLGAKWAGGTSIARHAVVAAVLLVAVALMALPIAPATAETPGRDRVHPALAKMVDEHPNGMVRVIVQGKNGDGALGTVLDREGAQRKRALGLIGAYAAEMPASRIRALAQDPSIGWVTVDAPMAPTVATDNLGTIYPLAVRADHVWNGGTSYTGTGIGVAVLDSGINNTGAVRGKDFGNRIAASVTMLSGANLDQYGHGTHVAGIIANSGAGSKGKYIGVAPDAELINVKVSDDHGMAYVSDVINALHWVVDNRAKYNIRVVNLSLVSTVPESYLTSPLDGAVEAAWLSGIAVVVAAGNDGAGSVLYPPANDPFVITVGAADNGGTVSVSDDVIPSWSSFGTTQDGFAKPELVAPGRRIVSNLAADKCVLALQLPDRVVDKNYFRLSGTSMAAPVVSGIAALTFQAHRDWTPDQLKYALMQTARPVAGLGAGSGEVDALGTILLSAPAYANEGLPLNANVASGSGVTSYNSATWNSATWNSATWNSATWNSATWNSATWSSATWNASSFASKFPD